MINQAYEKEKCVGDTASITPLTENESLHVVITNDLDTIHHMIGYNLPDYEKQNRGKII